MSWKDNPFGGLVSDGGTGWADGVFQGLALRDMDDAINEWQQYAWSLERKLEVAEENVIKWRYLALHNDARANVHAQFVNKAFGKKTSELIGGTDEFLRRVKIKEKDPEFMAAAEEDFANVTIRR